MSTEPKYKLSAHATLAINARGIDLAWVQACVESPDRTEPDRLDPSLLHALKRIDAFGGRILRVVYNPRTSPQIVVTAFFDRGAK